MLYILEMIGKGIGIGLLCILILLVSVLLALLFVPFRYRLQGKKEETGRPEGMVRVSWLFSLLSCFAVWEGKLHYGVKICGISIFDNLKKGRRKKAQKKQSIKKEKKTGRTSEKRGGGEPALPEQKEEIRRETAPALSEKEREEPEAVPQPVQTGKETGQEEDGQKQSGRGIWDKLHKIWEKVLSFFRKLDSLIEKLLAFPGKICEKVQAWKEKADWYLGFFQKAEFQRAAALLKKQLLFLWRSIRPRRVWADIRFGFADPSRTGQVLAWAGMMYPFFGKTVTIRPDFEEAVCSGKAVIKGRVILFDLLRAALILYFNKDIRKLIRIWKKEETVHDRQ